MQLTHYEAHMGLDGVEQLQALESITRDQLAAFPIQSVAILGIAGGNGLSHIPDCVRRIVGFDINQDYLDVCRERYGDMGDRLELRCADLSRDGAHVPRVDLVLANLFVEYVGINQFSGLMQACGAQTVSCAVQVNTEAQFVSDSPYALLFSKIEELHRDIEPRQLNDAMEKVGYRKLQEIKYDLPNGKYLLRIDYEKHS
jgi:hypothetical protein